MGQTAKLDRDEYENLMKSACFVCRIVEGNPLTPGVRIVYEDDNFIAFLNQFPTQEGYTIVSPKRHVERFEEDMTAEEWAELQIKVRKVAGAVSKATDAMRMYIASWGKQDRNNHIHIHVCPCPQGTPLEKQELAAMQRVNGAYLNLRDDKLDEIVAKIKAHLDQ